MKDRLKQIRKEDPHGKTQDTFAEFLGISKQNVSSYEMGRRKPSDGVIQLICGKCNIREEWLRNGTGKKDIPIDKNDEISKLFGSVLKSDDNNFKYRLINALAKLDDSGWDNLEKLIDAISEKK